MFDYSCESLNFVGVRLKGSSNTELNDLKLSNETTSSILSNELNLPCSKKYASNYTYLVNYSDILEKKEKKKQFKPSVSSNITSNSTSSSSSTPITPAVTSTDNNNVNSATSSSSSGEQLPSSSSATNLDNKDIIVEAQVVFPPSNTDVNTSNTSNSTNSRESLLEKMMEMTKRPREICAFYLETAAYNLDEAIEYLNSAE